MKGFLIDPTLKSIVEIDIESDFDLLKKIISCKYASVISFHPNSDIHIIYFDDEWRGKDTVRTFFVRCFEHHVEIGGKAVVFGLGDGGDASATCNASQLLSLVRFESEQHILLVYPLHKFTITNGKLKASQNPEFTCFAKNKADAFVKYNDFKKSKPE